MKNLVILFLVLFLTACLREKDEEIIARVNREVLTMEELKANFTDSEWEKLDRNDKMRFIEEWVNLTVMSQEAEKTGLTETLEIRQKMNLATKNIKANAILAQKLSEIEISEDDLFNYYKMHKSKYQSEFKQYKLQRIFLKEKAKLDTVLQVLKSGMKYTDATIQYSEESIGKDGGYTGFLDREDIEPAVWNAVQNLDKWQYTSVKVEKGFYIIRYYETRDVNEETPFTEVKAEIRKIVEKEKMTELYENFLNELKSTSDILISL